MENQTPVTPVNQKTPNFLVILLSILLIISLTIAGFFAFQTQKLVKELTLLRSEPTPAVTVEPTPEPAATDSPLLIQTNEETEVRNFADIYAKTYIAGDWTKLKTLLTSTVAKEMSEGMTNLQSGENLLDSYKILSIVKGSTGNYIVTIQFTKNGQSYKNPTGDPKIIVTKENGLWKSISWYLYQ